MLRRTAVAPLQVFEVQHALVIHQVGVGALPAAGLPYSVKLNQDVMARGRLVIGSPCSGHGFKFAPAIGERLAELATGQGVARDAV